MIQQPFAERRGRDCRQRETAAPDAAVTLRLRRADLESQQKVYLLNYFASAGLGLACKANGLGGGRRQPGWRAGRRKRAAGSRLQAPEGAAGCWRGRWLS